MILIILLISDFFSLLFRQPPVFPLFPYTTLFRSRLRCTGTELDPIGPTQDITEQAKDPRWGWYATGPGHGVRDRKSTRLNSSHVAISYAVFCLKKKKLL